MSRTFFFFKQWKAYLQKKPLVRGIVTYVITWPVGSLIQQTLEAEEYSLIRTVKFGLYGGLYVAPTLYGWMKLSCIVFPKPTLLHSAIKVR